MTNESLANEIERQLYTGPNDFIEGPVVRFDKSTWKEIIAALRANAAPQGGIPRPDLDHTDGGQAEWPDSPAPEEEMASRTDKAGPGKTLAELLEAARNHKMTPEEIFEQKVSFIWGMQKLSVPGYSKEQIRDMLLADVAAPDFLPSPAAGHAEGGVGGDAFDDWMHEYLCSGRVSDSRCDPTTVLFNLNDMREAYEAGAPK